MQKAERYSSAVARSVMTFKLLLERLCRDRNGPTSSREWSAPEQASPPQSNKRSFNISPRSCGERDGGSPSTLTRRFAPPSPNGRGIVFKIVPLPLGEGGAKRRVRVEGLPLSSI